MARRFNGTATTGDTLRRDVAASVVPYPTSMFAWVKPYDLTNVGTALWIGDSTRVDSSFAIGVRGSTNPTKASAAAYQSNFTQALSAADYRANVWQSIGGRFNSNVDRSVYLDGVRSDDTSSNTTIGTPNRTSVGTFDRADGAVTSWFNGEVAHAAIWSASLTDGEFKQLAAGWSPLLIRPESLVFYMPLGAKDEVNLAQPNIAYTVAGGNFVGTTSAGANASYTGSPTPESNTIKVARPQLGSKL